MSWADAVPGQLARFARLTWLQRECLQAWRPFWHGGAAVPERATQAAMLLRTSYFRQAACFAFVFLLVTLGSIVWGQHLIEQVLLSHVKDMVAAEIRTHQTLGRQDNSHELALALSERETTMPRRERVAAVQSASGQLLYGTSDLLSPALCESSGPPCQGWLRAHQESASGVHEWLGHAFVLPDGGRYVIAYDILPMLDRIYPIPLAVGLSMLLVLLAALWVGLYFSLGAVRRIDLIRQAMAQFVRGDMDSRVSLRGHRDEFDQLGHDVNHALGRIERLMDEVRNATNHIAHELRTPLTRLQQRLSNVADAAQHDMRVCDELALADEETQRILYLFKAVMRISEIETGRCQHETTPVDVAVLLTDLQDYYSVLTDERGLALRIHLEPLPPLLGDRALLFQALVNLVDNAVKYAPPGSAITLLARANADTVELGVADEGPGIDIGLRAQAVQRFRRLTRDRSIAGHGLGLALVQAVAGLHGGQLILADNRRLESPTQRGLLAVLSLPAPHTARACDQS